MLSLLERIFNQCLMMQRLTRNLQIILGGCIAAPFCTILKEQGVIRRSGYRNFAERTNKRAPEKKIK